MQVHKNLFKETVARNETLLLRSRKTAINLTLLNFDDNSPHRAEEERILKPQTSHSWLTATNNTFNDFYKNKQIIIKYWQKKPYQTS